MIEREQMTFIAQGERFYPSRVTAPYSSSHNPGVIGKLGRYKDRPVPYGVADFQVPEVEKEKIAYLHRIVSPHLKALRAAGAEEFRLHISYFCRSQCAIGFSREEIRMLSELECDLPIDCYTENEEGA